MSISSIHDGSLEFECSDSPDRSPVCPGNSGRVVLPFTPRAGKVGFRYPIEASISGGSVQEDAASGMDEDSEGGGDPGRYVFRRVEGVLGTVCVVVDDAKKKDERWGFRPGDSLCPVKSFSR